MSRVVLAVLTSWASAPAIAAQLPKDITPEARAAFVKKWQGALVAERDKWQKQTEEGRELMKFAATAAEGKKKLAEAQAALARLEKNPAQVPGTPVVTAGEKPAIEGTVCVLQAAGGEYTVTDVSADGVLVEGALQKDGKTIVVRYLVASPLKVPKAGKKEPVVTLPGLWYVAGTAEVKGKAVPVLYRFELTKDDFPSKK